MSKYITCQILAYCAVDIGIEFANQYDREISQLMCISLNEGLELFYKNTRNTYKKAWHSTKLLSCFFIVRSS